MPTAWPMLVGGAEVVGQYRLALLSMHIKAVLCHLTIANVTDQLQHDTAGLSR